MSRPLSARRPGLAVARRAVTVVLAVVVAVGAALAVVGWLQPRSLVVLGGDSITAYSDRELAGALDGTFGLGGHDVEVIARPGATAGDMAPEIIGAAARQPEQVIINLGTNDAVRTGTVAEGLAGIEQMAAAFGSARCIHLVTLSESMVAFEDPTGPGRRAAELNRGIVALAEREGYGLIRWDEMVADGTARGEPLTLDSIHPDGTGAARLAAAYADAVAGC